MKRCRPWPKRTKENSRVWEHVWYLIPGAHELTPLPEPELDGIPEGWETRSDGLSMEALNLDQLREKWPRDSFEQWVNVNASPGLREQTLQAPAFTLISGKITARDDFALHQTGLALCKSALRAGGIGVLDRLAQRFFSPEALHQTSKDAFDIEDHIGIRIEKGLCQTRGLSEKFGASDYAIRVSSPHQLGVAVHLLNEISDQVANGKHYGEKSLFRKRMGAHVCQFLFRPLDPDSDFSIFEAVDMVIEQNVIKPSVNADGALEYFAQGDPHWNASYGWPPRDFPSQTTSTDSPNLFGIIPGITQNQEVLEVLGAPSGKSAMPQRWLFSHKAWDTPLRMEIHHNSNTISKIVSNGLAIGNKLFTDGSGYQEIRCIQGKEILSRQFVAPPDQNLVRTERVWATPHPTNKGETLLTSLQFDHSDTLWQCELQHLLEAPQTVLESLAPSYGTKLLTGYVPEFPKGQVELSAEALQLRTYLESSVQMIRQLLIQFGKKEWVNESLDGYAMTAGTYLLNEGVPNRRLLEEIGLPAHIFLNAFEALEIFLEHPATQNRMTKADQKGLTPKELGAFTWLLENLSGPQKQDLDLAIDLAQVFKQYQIHLGAILPKSENKSR